MFLRSALAFGAVTAACAGAVPLCAAPQSLPAPVSSPAADASPNPIGPALGAGDPCTSMSAIVSRPSVTSSVCTVRPNHVEIETGYVNTSASAGGNVVTYPTAMVRIGTPVPALEVQIAPPSLVRSNAGGIATASADTGAGLKYVFGYTPKLSYGGQAFFTVPTGVNGASANGATSTYAFNAAYTLSPVFSLATTLAAGSLTNGAQRWSSFAPTLVLGASLPNAEGAFAEIATFGNALGPGSATRTQYMIGVYRGLGPRVQVDASAAFSPTAATGRYRSVGFGVSAYF